jgi:HSP20 family protein
MSEKKSEVSKDVRPAGSITPWGAFEGLPGDIGKMMEQFFHRDPFQRFGLPSRLKGFDWSPTVDVAERPDSYEITAELPGAEEKDVTVTVEDGVLTIAGEKKAERREDTKTMHFSERNYGSFQRSFGLPDDADDEKVSANFAKGVLKVSVPRSKKAKPSARQVAIKAA